MNANAPRDPEESRGAFVRRGYQAGFSMGSVPIIPASFGCFFQK
jgi:hypothetical protein